MYIKKDCSLKSYNTFNIECCADIFVEFDSKDMLREIIHDPQVRNKSLYVLGGGSNTLFTADFEGVILHPIDDEIDIISAKGNSVYVKASAGVSWDDFVCFCINNNLWGAENLSYIPGSVGASPVQNIGAYSVEAKDIIHSVEVYNIEHDSFDVIYAKDCMFSYRDSIFKHALKGKVIVVSVIYKLSVEAAPILNYSHIKEEVYKYGEPSLQNIRDVIITTRKEKLPDPKVIGNGGSFFKNPIVSRHKAEYLLELHSSMPFYVTDAGFKLSAAWLIDKAGWKGYRHKDVGVHDKQPLVLVNYGKATGVDILNLSERIAEDVSVKFDVEISPEINIL